MYIHVAMTYGVGPSTNVNYACAEDASASSLRNEEQSRAK
jgi:hypothetical protein